MALKLLMSSNILLWLLPGILFESYKGSFFFLELELNMDTNGTHELLHIETSQYVKVSRFTKWLIQIICIIHSFFSWLSRPRRTLVLSAALRSCQKQILLTQGA